jgi:hypothetical protein
MARRKKSIKKAGGAVVDFTKAKESEGGRVRLPEDDYHVKILGGKEVTSSEKETPGIAIVFQIVDGKKKGKKVTERFWLSPKALPRLRNLLETCGMKTPKKVRTGQIIKALKGKELGITLQDEEYEGRISSRVAYDFLTLEDLEGEVDDDEDEDDLEDEEDEDEEEDEEDDDEDLDEMDRAELKAYIKENELDVKVKKSMDEDDIRTAIQEAEGDDEEEDDDEDLEELDLNDL